MWLHIYGQMDRQDYTYVPQKCCLRGYIKTLWPITEDKTFQDWSSTQNLTTQNCKTTFSEVCWWFQYWRGKYYSYFMFEQFISGIYYILYRNKWPREKTTTIQNHISKRTCPDLMGSPIVTIKNLVKVPHI